MKEKISIIRVMKYAGAYIAFEIGSGFATGQEILQFYTSYGTMGIAGAIVSMILFSWAGGSLQKSHTSFFAEKYWELSMNILFCFIYLQSLL